MRLPSDPPVPSQTASVSASGAFVPNQSQEFVPRLPSTWPAFLDPADSRLVSVLRELLHEGMLAELENVCSDAIRCNPGGLQGRGHVVGVAMMAILDAVSCFASPKERQCERIPSFIQRYFPREYHVIAQDISDWYRNGLVHEWFMRKVAFLPGTELLRVEPNEAPVVGLLAFKAALESAVALYLTELTTDEGVRRRAGDRYRTLQSDVRA